MTDKSLSYLLKRAYYEHTNIKSHELNQQEKYIIQMRINLFQKKVLVLKKNIFVLD